jgi:fermentation-respiration switch protein FrsA (DUF1100 family)
MPTGLLLKTRHGNEIPIRYINLGFEYTVLLSHGNAEDILRVEEWVVTYFLKAVRANVLLYEYTGYSSEDSKPSEKYVYSDAEAAFWFLTDTLRVPKEKVILYGRSLGSGPSTYLASQHTDVGGLILQTPISSIYRVIVNFRYTLPGDMFANVDMI